MKVSSFCFILSIFIVKSEEYFLFLLKYSHLIKTVLKSKIYILNFSMKISFGGFAGILLSFHKSITLLSFFAVGKSVELGSDSLLLLIFLFLYIIDSLLYRVKNMG